MSHTLHTSTEHITAPLADEGNYACCQSRGAHNIKHNLWKLALRDHLSTEAPKRGIELGTFCSQVNRSRPQLCFMHSGSFMFISADT